MKKVKRKSIQSMYLNRYPYLTLREIEKEMQLFEVEITASKKIQKETSNYHKYRRGWLSRANYQASIETKLEEEIAEWKEAAVSETMKVDKLESQNRQMRKALEFYSMRRNDDPANFWNNFRAIETLKQLE